MYRVAYDGDPRICKDGLTALGEVMEALEKHGDQLPEPGKFGKYTFSRERVPVSGDDALVARTPHYVEHLDKDGPARERTFYYTLKRQGSLPQIRILMSGDDQAPFPIGVLSKESIDEARVWKPDGNLTEEFAAKAKDCAIVLQDKDAKITFLGQDGRIVERTEKTVGGEVERKSRIYTPEGVRTK
jgi:hypothetical protein